MPKIILADGTTFDCEFCGVSSTGVLYLDIVGISMANAVTLFGNNEKTSKIIYRTSTENSSQDTEYKNFTVLVGVNALQNLGGIMRVSMRRPYVGE